MAICLHEDLAPLHDRRKLKSCQVETVEVIEEDSEEMVPRAHLAKEDLPTEEAYDLLT